ncbi:MAG: hypothetical protein LRZ85_07960 [Alphaproteobacteria bacterium]|nr:hypothetical protein [Alphaproteobacteria bacterium]
MAPTDAASARPIRGTRKRGDDPPPAETAYLDAPSDDDMRTADEILKKLQVDARKNVTD